MSRINYYVGTVSGGNLRSVQFFTACTLAKSPEAILSIRGSGSFVASAAARIAAAWSEPVSGCDFHLPWTSAFSRRTEALG